MLAENSVEFAFSRSPALRHRHEAAREQLAEIFQIAGQQKHDQLQHRKMPSAVVQSLERAT